MENGSVLVIGLGISGRSAAALLLQKKNSVHGVDGKWEQLRSNSEIIDLCGQGMTISHDQEALDLDQFDLVVVSPGISQKHPLYVQAKEKGIEILGEIELAFRYLEGIFVGITGTNGKTTTTLLVTHVLNECGKPARALGNVGVPLTSQCGETLHSKEINVVELSSYQLETMHTHVLDVAVLLNITPDHLDRYHSMEEYANAKLHIANCLKSEGILYLEQQSWLDFGYLTPKLKAKTYGYGKENDLFTDLQHLYSGKKIECVLPLQLQGKKSHDLENLMAAYALCSYLGVTGEQFIQAVASFKKPAHRVEFVKTVKGISYYDDSKGTNIDAVIRAIQSVPGKIVLIAGGVDKGSSYEPWIQCFADKVRGIFVIGQAAAKMQRELSHALPVVLCESLEKAVAGATEMAEMGETVLLSPGCSSFDMFRDYAHRGEEFQRLVQQL